MLMDELSPLSHELRTDSFAAQCAFTRFRAQYEVDLNPVTFLQPATASLQLALPEPAPLLTRLVASARQFVRDFGKRVPRVAATGELRFLLPDEALLERLPREFWANWEDFKRDPQGFLTYLWRGEGNTPVRRRRLQTGTAVAMASYVLVFTTLIVAGALQFGAKETLPELKVVELIRLSSPAPIAKAENGPEYVPSGKGGVAGGSKLPADPARSGGGGGRKEPRPAPLGNPPQFSPLPQVMPPNPAPIRIDTTLVVPETVLGEANSSKPFPRPVGVKDGSEASPASGPGGNAGLGTGNGTGTGPGNGTGYSTENKNNAGGGLADLGLGLSDVPHLGDGAEIFNATNALQPRITFQEKARYTEEARQNGVRGTVVLSIVFGADGRLYDIQVLHGLPQGLTETAIEAAKKIRFRPALRNGAPVNVRMQLRYNFNLL
jgi:TonB family protein